MSAFGRLASLPPERRTLLARALAVVAWYRVALWLLPFRWVQALPARAAKRRRPSRTALELAEAVTAAAKRVPHASCLTQALALQSLLVKEGYAPTLKLGVAKTPGGALEAHAWVEADGRILIGGPESARFVPLLPGARAEAEAPGQP